MFFCSDLDIVQLACPTQRFKYLSWAKRSLRCHTRQTAFKGLYIFIVISEQPNKKKNIFPKMSVWLFIIAVSKI